MKYWLGKNKFAEAVSQGCILSKNYFFPPPPLFQKSYLFPYFQLLPLIFAFFLNKSSYFFPYLPKTHNFPPGGRGQNKKNIHPCRLPIFKRLKNIMKFIRSGETQDPESLTQIIICNHSPVSILLIQLPCIYGNDEIKKWLFMKLIDRLISVIDTNFILNQLRSHCCSFEMKKKKLKT